MNAHGPSGVPPYAIGGLRWPGLAKLIEEAGELGQVAGKLMAYPHGHDHPDGGGPLIDRLEAELGDLLGVVDYLIEHNAGLRREVIEQRRLAKFERFQGWHEDERR